MIVLSSILLSIVLALPASKHEHVPPQALAYRARLIREAHAAGGLSAPVPMFAAQLHQESGWRTDARSGVGAVGLAQFMPGTAAWISNLYPADLKPGVPYDAGWAIRALVMYDYWLNKRVPMFREGDERWAAALASYNAGLGWIKREQKLASNPTLYFNSVDQVCLRAQTACIETRSYPERILHVLRPLYVDWN